MNSNVLLRINGKMLKFRCLEKTKNSKFKMAERPTDLYKHCALKFQEWYEIYKYSLTSVLHYDVMIILEVCFEISRLL